MTNMATAQEYLAKFVAVSMQRAKWDREKVEFEIRASFTKNIPDDTLISSVRCILRKDDKVMVVRDPDRVHIMPGGRREKGETNEETLNREVAEETGYKIIDSELVGVMHFRHLLNMPEGWDAKFYPHMFQLVYSASPGEYDINLREESGYELETGFMSLEELHRLELDTVDKTFLAYVLETSNK